MLSNDSRSCTTLTDEITSVETVEADIDNTEILETANSHEAIRSDNETKTENKKTRKPKEKHNENTKKAKRTDIKSDKKTDKTTDKTNTKTLKKRKSVIKRRTLRRRALIKKLKHQLRKILPFRKAVSHNGSESKVSDRANNVLEKDNEALLQNNDRVQTEIKAPCKTEVTVHQDLYGRVWSDSDSDDEDHKSDAERKANYC
ncbi:hypothetical protein DPMN_026177 [Dreissena polymorpha]|uniref:Uncharacterized protein n=1 Tax=Dreissena polymorpha TaxID=45954 RepID=A0A9D4LQM5_DREPO|nr:hypothetical protein DPMN_026177 [Dreissena polymorpha]